MYIDMTSFTSLIIADSESTFTPTTFSEAVVIPVAVIVVLVIISSYLMILVLTSKAITQLKIPDRS